MNLVRGNKQHIDTFSLHDRITTAFSKFILEFNDGARSAQCILDKGTQLTNEALGFECLTLNQKFVVNECTVADGLLYTPDVSLAFCFIVIERQTCRDYLESDVQFFVAELVRLGCDGHLANKLGKDRMIY